ncbi:MAG TPA: SRPBCC domain-containing protein [Tepidisphaeraceae bacterium]|jgi:uncharacterized protein YndB with AHSA1/START domain|nr:SRPBCC domain-containing protein [Tepidisphaeraceae bacterium]
MAAKKSTPSKEPTFVLTRIFDAPRELVFTVWTDPKHIVNWWGPGGFTAPYATVDLRIGGALHYCMRGPDGKDYWTKGFFHEIIVPEKLVCTMFFSDKDGNLRSPADYGMSGDFPTEMLDTVTFAALAGNKTKLTLRRSTPMAISKRYMEDQGWNSSLDKLAAELARIGKKKK